MLEIGDHFVIGLQPTPTLSDHDKHLLSELRPAGVVLFKPNFRHDLPYHDWLESHAKMLSSVRESVEREHIFVAVDHEGGRVFRVPQPLTRIPAAAHWAAHAGDIGKIVGKELASIGVNVNFAPVLDVHSNPQNFVIGERAFGRRTSDVIAAGLAFMASMQEYGVLACGKHFPGHGDTYADPHYGLPALNLSISDLKARELLPFQAAVKANIPMIMTSHIIFPQIDPGRPVTISHRFVTGILRDELGFDGVVISDDIGMQAASRFFENPEAAVDLILAGCDLLMICAYWTNTNRATTFAKAIIEGMRCGRLNPKLIEISKLRIRKAMRIAKHASITKLPPSHFTHSSWAQSLPHSRSDQAKPVDQ